MVPGAGSVHARVENRVSQFSWGTRSGRERSSRTYHARLREAVLDGVRGLVSEQPSRLADVGERVADVARAEIPVNGAGALGGGSEPSHLVADEAEELVERRASAERDVVDLPVGIGAGREGGQDVPRGGSHV